MKYKKIRDYKYILWSDEEFKTPIKGFSAGNNFIGLSPEGILTIKRGYAWDGPSGPTIDTKCVMRGSLIHDALYQLIREGLLPQSCKEVADIALKRAIIEDVEKTTTGFLFTFGKFRAWYFYRGVLRFGASSCEPDLLEAP